MHTYIMIHNYIKTLIQYPKYKPQVQKQKK